MVCMQWHGSYEERWFMMCNSFGLLRGTPERIDDGVHYLRLEAEEGYNPLVVIKQDMMAD